MEELTRLGQRGYAVSLSFGNTLNERGHAISGWICIIGARSIGSATMDYFVKPPFGYHPSDPAEAARLALDVFRTKYPEEAA